MSASPDLGAFLLRGADELSDFVTIVDQHGCFEYVNPYGLTALGRRGEDLIGRPVTDILHPEDAARAVMNIGRVLDPGVTVPVTPGFYRFRRADGSYLRMEANGCSFAPAPGEERRMVIMARPTTDADLHEQLMDLLTSDAPSDKAFELVPEFGEWRQPGLRHAVFWRDDQGQPRAAGSAVLLELGGLDDPATPWAQVGADGVEVLRPVAELDPAFRARAERVGVTHVRVLPVWDPLHHTHASVVSAVDHGSPQSTDVHVLEITGYVLQNMARVLGLVLGWRRQVIELRQAAATDPLTGLANRSGFRAAVEVEDLRAAPGLLGVLFIDLDHFKEINDTHGHLVGDEVLTGVADRLRRVVRPQDIVARLGGDEFAVVAPGLADRVAAEAVAARIIDVVATPLPIGDGSLRVGVSIGISAAPAGERSYEQLLLAADAALYDAKAGGRGRWAVAGEGPEGRDGVIDP